MPFPWELLESNLTEIQNVLHACTPRLHAHAVKHYNVEGCRDDDAKNQRTRLSTVCIYVYSKTGEGGMQQ